MEDATSRLGMLGSVLGRLGPAGLIVGASVAALGYGMHQLVVPVAEVGEELNKLSQKTAVSVEALSALLYASELSDVSAESLTKALKFLSTAMFDAKVKGGEGSAALKAFGVSALDAQGQIRPTEQVLLDLAEKFAAMPDSAEKAALAVKLFGKNGLDMIPMLNQGRDGLTEMMEEAKRLGLVMSADAARAAEEFNDNMKRLHAVNEGVQRRLETRWKAPVKPGDTITPSGCITYLKATGKSRWVGLAVQVRNQRNEVVAEGEAMAEFPV